MQSYKFVSACVSAALLAACGGNNGISSSTPTSVTPSLVRSLPFGPDGSRRIRKNVQTETVLYGFAGGSDGELPEAALTNVAGTLYGTTSDGGANGLGTVFASTTSGAETVLYSFAGGSDGANPLNGTLTNVDGTLYGTTEYGGANGFGTVYMITTSGTESVLYSFAGGSDGEYPYAGVTYVGGALYGTTSNGGASGYGTVFKLKCRVAGCTESVIHSFAGGSDGANPTSDLTNVGGTLFSTTESGGASNFGTVFKIATSGTESVLYSFAGGSDGAYPLFSGVTKVGSTLFSTTFRGGARDLGTIYKITTSGTETVLYSFAGGSDGKYPYAGVTYVGGTLYGTTSEGGVSNNGTIFALLAKSKPEIVLYSFAGGSDGASPYAGRLTNVGGTLFGTTRYGGGTGCGGVGCGAIFSLSF